MPRRPGRQRPKVPTGRSVRPDNATGVQRPERPATGNNGGDFQGSKPGDLERIAERRQKALGLRKLGMSYRDIATQCGTNVHTAYDDVQAELLAIREMTEKAAEELRQLELERLDLWTAKAMVRFNAGDVKAGFLLVKLSERRAKLTGLDAAQKHEVTGADGGPLVVQRAALAKLSDEELAALEGMLSKILEEPA